MADRFIPNPDKKRTVNHKNGIITDNSIENLEWMTYSENHLHAINELGRKILVGVEKGGAKLNDDTVRLIRHDLNNGMSQRKTAKKHSMSRGAIQRIANGSTWSHVV